MNRELRRARFQVHFLVGRFQKGWASTEPRAAAGCQTRRETL